MKNQTYQKNSSATDLQPVRISERINSVDIIRGVALLGILLINIEMFSQPLETLVNPLLAGNFVGSNYYIWIIKEYFVTTKMWALFSILFGAGAYLLITRAENKGNAAGIADIYYRRLFWLLLFAIIHAYLIWSGDILFFYAIAGLFLYPLRKLPVWGLFIAVFLLLSLLIINSSLDYLDNVSMNKQVVEIEKIRDSGGFITDDQQAVIEEWSMKNAMNDPEKEIMQKKIETMSRGTYCEIIKSEKEWVRSGHAEVFYPWLFFETLMLMILGMALMKSGILSAGLSKKFYFLLMVIGYIIGFSLATIRIQNMFKHNFGILSIDAIIGNIERVAVALGHIGLICLFCKSNILGWLKKLLTATGRMAFTNYILQSLFGIFIFYGFGFGMYGTLDRTQQLVVVVAIWLLQLFMSPIWLKFFYFGPLEWIWRSLTYWKIQPFRVR